ncbi:hypothetical protein EBZ80_04940 [bacterium]|nr:hypothetical protein [bacterium]
MRYIRCLCSMLCVALAAPHPAFVPPLYRHRPTRNETAERYRVYEDMRRFFSSNTTGHGAVPRVHPTAEIRDEVYKKEP